VEENFPIVHIPLKFRAVLMGFVGLALPKQADPAYFDCG
jgi:hypothetical protein